MQLIPIAPRDFRIISACLIAKYIFSFPEKSFNSEVIFCTCCAWIEGQEMLARLLDAEEPASHNLQSNPWTSTLPCICTTPYVCLSAFSRFDQKKRNQ